MFHVPAGASELRGQPVEQFGLRRPFALYAEILRGLHNANAKKLLPKPVHVHARGEGMRRVHQPLRQTQAVLRRVLGPGRKNGRNTRLNLLAFFVVLAAHQQEGVARFVEFLCDHRGGNLLFDDFLFLAPFRHRIEQFFVLRRDRSPIIIPHAGLVIS